MIRQKPIVFHPYFLKQFLGSWYAVGYSEHASHNDIRVFRLERMQKLKPLNLNFKKTDNINPYRTTEIPDLEAKNIRLIRQ